MIISVASGKGGTGKTLVATSLALSLKDMYNVQLLDCDVEEPNDHVFIKPSFSRSETVSIAIAVTKQKVLVFPQLCHGCGACSYLCPEEAISEVSNDIGVIEAGNANGVDFIHGKLDVGQMMAPPIIRKVKDLTDKNKVVIIDASPGTSCPVVEAVKDSDFCLLVTEPTPFGLNDLALAVETVRQLDMPCGIVLNRAGVGDGKTEEYCLRENLPIMLTVPLDTGIAHLYSRGIPLVEGMPQFKNSFIELFDKIGEVVNEGNSNPER